MDLLRKLGPLALASRLRRLSDRLMNEVNKFYEKEQSDFKARWFPIIYLLRNESPLSIMTISEKLGMTHPYVIQLSKQMINEKLLLSQKDTRDKRIRLLSLSAKGNRMVDNLEGLWDNISKCTQELIEESDVNLIKAIAKIENKLNNKSMYARLTSQKYKQ